MLLARRRPITVALLTAILALTGLVTVYFLRPAAAPAAAVSAQALPLPPDPALPSQAGITQLSPAATATQGAAATPTAGLPALRSYTVQPGDTGASIAQQFGIGVNTLSSANGLPDPSAVQAGQTLLIPSVDGVVHTVQPGETLHDIAAQYGLDAGTIIQVNQIANPDLLVSGTKLLIPGVQPTATPTAAPSATPTAVLPAPPQLVSDEPPPAVSARAVAVVDQDSGQLLYGNNEHAELPPASITKIVTTIVALENAPDLDRMVPVTISGSAMAAQDGSSIMGLEPGLTVSIRTLLYGMMLPSGNDAAEQIALVIGGTREHFVDMMNAEVASIGLHDTHFVTPSGMDANGHYTSAYDMAMLARYAMQDPTFRTLTSSPTYTGDGFTLHNINRLLGQYNGMDGVKIGETDRAGVTYVASATRNGHRVYVVLMHTTNLYAEATSMLDWVWRSYQWQ